MKKLVKYLKGQFPEVPRDVIIDIIEENKRFTKDEKHLKNLCLMDLENIFMSFVEEPLA